MLCSRWVVVTRLQGALKRKSSFRKKGGKVRVLSVDDDPVNQLVIQNLLAPEGYEILQVCKGQQGGGNPLQGACKACCATCVAAC